MGHRILLVDDDTAFLAGYHHLFSKRLPTDTAACGAEGLRTMAERSPYSVVVSDFQMPGMDGVEFLARVREVVPDTVRMMLSGVADLELALDAVNTSNIFRLLTKPCPLELLGKGRELTATAIESMKKHAEYLGLAEPVRAPEPM